MNTLPHSPPVFADSTEHHEVAEGRTVQGHDMTFNAPVYGEVVSDGGRIHLKHNLGWGKAVNPGGHILARQRTFNATLQAPGGVVEIASAESCLIIGREVRVREAVKCQIFAHTLHLGMATGCMIAARSIDIRHAKPHKLEPNLITLVVPELEDVSELLAPLHAELALTKSRVDGLTARIDAFKADAALAQYLAIRVKVRAGMAKLTSDQAQGYLQMEERWEETAKALELAVAERRPLAKALTATAAQVQSIRDGQDARLADCRCKIARVDGETIVRQLLDGHDDPDLSLIPLPMIPKILFRNDASVKVICAVQAGTVDWAAAKNA
jgi:hypothetical protein